MSYNPSTGKWEYDFRPPYKPGWLSSRNKRKHQRHMNKAMRLVNNMIKNDPLWRGRFYVRSGATCFCLYEDGSGGELFCKLLFFDKKTGRTVKDYESVNHWCYFGGHHLFERMNEFIIEDCKVWSENPGPRMDNVDYNRR